MIGGKWMTRGIVNDWRESVRCKGNGSITNVWSLCWSSQRKGKHVQTMNCD